MSCRSRGVAVAAARATSPGCSCGRAGWRGNVPPCDPAQPAVEGDIEGRSGSRVGRRSTGNSRRLEPQHVQLHDSLPLPVPPQPPPTSPASPPSPPAPKPSISRHVGGKFQSTPSGLAFKGRANDSSQPNAFRFDEGSADRHAPASSIPARRHEIGIVQSVVGPLGEERTIPAVDVALGR